MQKPFGSLNACRYKIIVATTKISLQIFKNCINITSVAPMAGRDVVN